jgi:putative aminopeptidase FrvX
MMTEPDKLSLKQALRSRLAALTALDGVSGHEQAVVAYLRDALVPLADEVRVDSMGNVYATLAGQGRAPHLMLEAHSDEIGATVKSIQPDGYLRILGVGGVSPAMLVGRNVRVHGHHGVIGVKSGHLQTADERKRVAEVYELYVDMGAGSAEAVAFMGIRVGDAVAYDSPLQDYANPDRVSGKAIDNRIGCAVLLQVLKELDHRAPAGTLSVVICVQEEIGLRGARVASYTAQPDYAVAVDTFMSGDTPDVDYYRDLSAAIGRGPVLLLANSGESLRARGGTGRRGAAARVHGGPGDGSHRRGRDPSDALGHPDGATEPGTPLFPHSDMHPGSQ